jgi:hypothetical protein
MDLDSLAEAAAAHFQQHTPPLQQDNEIRPSAEAEGGEPEQDHEDD